ATPGTTPGGLVTLATAEAVRPEPPAPPDPRFPWKAQGTRKPLSWWQRRRPAPRAPPDPRSRGKARGPRKPLSWWQRVRYLVLFAVVFEVLVWSEYLQFSPAETWWEAQHQVAWSQQWLMWLAGLEVLRQVHMFVAEKSARYNRFWSE